MALNLDTTFKLKAKVEGARSVDNFKKQLRGLDGSSKMTKAQLGKMNIEINRMARAAGNTTKGLREHIRALTLLRDRTDIGGRAYKRLGTQIDKLKGKLKGLDGQAASTGQKLAGLLATVGMGRILRGVVGKASNYQAEVTKAAAIEGGGNNAQIEQAITATAQVAAGTPTEVAELATSLARAGFDANEISNSLNGIVTGAEATGVAFADMGSIVSNNLRAFGLETTKTNDLVDILVATANSSNQTIQDLGESLKYAAPIARSLGISVNDTAGMVALLANNGIKGSDAGTALRSSLTRLQMAASGANGELLNLTKGNEKLTKAFSHLGAEILDANGNLKPMDEVITTLRDKLQNFSKGQQQEITKALFGQQQASKMLALINQTDIDVAKLFKTIRESGGVSAETRKSMDSFALTTKVLGGNFEVLTNQIGAAFIKVLDPLAKILNELLTDFSKLPKPIKDFGAALAAAGIAALALKTTMMALTALGVKQLIFTKVAAAWALFTKAIGAAKVAMIAFNATNPIGWIALVITAIGTLGTVIYNFRKQILEFFKSVRNMLNKYVVMVFNSLPKFIRELLIGKNNRPAGDDFIIKLPKVKLEDSDGSNVLEGSTNLTKDGVGIDENTANKQKQILDGMKQGLEDYRSKIKDVATSIKETMSRAFQGMEDALVDFVMTGKLNFSSLANSIIRDLARIAIQQAIMKPLTGFLGNIFPFFKNENGNAVADGKVQKYAYGGVVSRPTLFPMANGMGLMGEAGAEAILPLRRGSNGKLGVQSTGGGATSIVVNVDASGSSVEGNDEEGRALGQLIATAIQSQLVKEKLPGGLLA